MSTIQEFILREYPVAHKQENGNLMSRRQISILARQLEKKLSTNGTGSEEVGPETLKWILYLDTLKTPVAQRAACKWFCKGTAILPEDENKILQAVKVAGLNHVDPLAYNRPMDIINKFEKLNREGKPIDPDTISTLHLNRRLDNGLAIYEVDETQESRINMRLIINTHYGVRCNPWCLLQADQDGILTPYSANYWRYYNAFPKQVAFQNGSLVAFSAGRCKQRVWWDRFDKPTYGTEKKDILIKGDGLQRRALCTTDRFTEEIIKVHGPFYKGNKEYGMCEKFHSLEDQVPYSIGYYWEGKRIMKIWPGMKLKQEKELGDKSDFEQGRLVIPSSITRIPDLDMLKSPKIKELILPDSIEEIAEGIFRNNETIQTIRMPSKTSAFNRAMFKGCRSLSSVNLSTALKEIPSYTFEGCSSIKEIHIPSRVTRIGMNAFAGCTSLVSINLPSRLRIISEHAFKGCSRLKTIKIPDSVAHIEDGAFEWCSSLETIILPSKLKKIAPALFRECRSLRQVLFSDSVETIGKNAFQGCEKLAEVVLPDGLKRIEANAFERCKAIQVLQFPENLNEIGACAFSLTGLKEVEVPETVTSLQPNSFSLCFNMTKLLVPNRWTGVFNERYGRRVRPTVNR